MALTTQEKAQRKIKRELEKAAQQREQELQRQRDEEAFRSSYPTRLLALVARAKQPAYEGYINVSFGPGHVAFEKDTGSSLFDYDENISFFMELGAEITVWSLESKLREVEDWMREVDAHLAEAERIAGVRKALIVKLNEFKATLCEEELGLLKVYV